MSNKHHIYLLLTNTGTLFTKTIKRFTHAPYNHSSISFDIHLNEVYSFGRKKAYNPLLAGFVREDIYNGTFSYFPKTTCSVYELEVTKEQLHNIRMHIQFFIENNQSFKYNLIGLLGVPLNISISRNTAYFCSQFVAEILKNANVYDFHKHSSLVTPNDFRKSEQFKLIYEGSLFAYPHLNREKIVFKKYRDHFPIYSKISTK